MYKPKLMRARLLILVGIIFTLCSSVIYANDGTTAVIIRELNKFEEPWSKKHITAANLLMEIFHKEGLTPTLSKFDQHTSASIISREVFYWSGEYFYETADYKKALDYSLKALPLATDTEIEADCLSLISLSYFRLSNFEKAAEYAKLCYILDEQTGDPDIMSSSLNTIAGIYLGANKPEEGEKYILKALELASKVDNPARMSVILGMASEIFQAQGKNKEALVYIEKACKIEQDLNRVDKMMVRLTQKASILIGMNRWNEAEETLNEALPHLQNSQNRVSYGIACNKMGMALLGQGRNKEAVTHFRTAAQIFSENGDLRNEMHSRKGLYESYWDENRDSAKIELDRFNDLRDSLYNSATAESLAKFGTEFDSIWLRLENQKQKIYIEIILTISLVITIFMTLNWWFLKRRSRIKEESLNNIIFHLKDGSPENVTHSTLCDSNQQFLRQIVSAIMNKISEKGYSVEALASDMCITRGHLNRKVKATTGLTTQQYILRVRMEYAKHMLLDFEELTISNIADRCGFEDAASFTRAFRRTFGKTPTQIRDKEL